MSERTPEDEILALWRGQIDPAGRPEIAALPSSGNNRLFQLTAGPQRAVAKWYYPAGPGERDRLDAEWRFLTHAEQSGLDRVPRPLARDSGGRLALYSFVKGRRPSPAEVTADRVTEAGAFLAALNQAPVPHLLPEAADARFTAAGHCDLLSARLGQLSRLLPADALDQAALDLTHAMIDAFAGWRPALLAALGRDGAAELPSARHWLSPSDFGFHNTLIGADDRLYFLDFEYAGRDDPAKTLADFFLQPAIPADRQFRDRFWAAAAVGRPDAALEAERARLLEPVFALKWCCIMLNPFRPDLAGRVWFADPGTAEATRKARQLDKATHAFTVLNRSDLPWLTSIS